MNMYQDRKYGRAKSDRNRRSEAMEGRTHLRNPLRNDTAARRALHRGRGDGLRAAHRPLAIHGDALTNSEGGSPPFRTSSQDALRAAGRPRAGPRASEASNPEIAPAKPAREPRARHASFLL